ncbi:MAG: 2-iminoacetate synthase ThiH [Thermoanaerobaculia bacterium]
MTFHERILTLEDDPVAGRLAPVAAPDVERALAGPFVSPDGFRALLSPAAGPVLERAAGCAHALTVQHFGRVILLYTPLYLSNFCGNACRYCGFAAANPIKRSRLTMPEVEEEARLIGAMGFHHVLVLTGDSRMMSPVEYIGDCVEILRNHFSSIAIEVYALETAEYAQLVDAGVDSLTIYQETYDRGRYAEVHPGGPKRNYRFRLEAPERACKAGVRSVNLGVLLGLGDWRRDVFLLGLHADYLQRLHPDVEVSISLPRLRPHRGSFEPECEVTDREFASALVALRLFLPRVGITISTRESATLRDHLIPLGVTTMSAGSSTSVRGHLDPSAEPPQFDISDRRDVPAVRRAIEAAGYKAIFKDWQPLGERSRAEGTGRRAGGALP